MTHVTARRYAMAGAFVALGAPAGLLVLRWIAVRAPAPGRFLVSELGSDPLLYLYVTVATATAFAAFGAVLGVLRERVESLSLTDSLTRLWNRRHFELQLDSEVRRAHRYHAPLSLLFVDL